MKVALIGAGNLGAAIIKMFLKNNIDFIAADKFVKEVEDVKVVQDNKEAVEGSDVVLLAVKPQYMEEVITEIKQDLKDKCIITVAAGLKIGFYNAILDNARITRVMPNMGLREGQGVIAYKFDEACTSDDKSSVEKVLATLGDLVEVQDEADLDLITGLSGSGIAYFIKIIDTFIKAGKDSGMDAETSKRVVLGTVKGAVELIHNSSYSNEEIITSIASKGGTTEQGLQELEEKKMDEILKGTIDRTISKCKELSKG